MAVKTTYVNGSYLTPSTLNNFIGTNAGTGHTHNGINSDGSVPKVLLTGAAHVTGLLPEANIAYDESTFTLTFGTDFIAPMIITCRYRLVPPTVAGQPKIVIISFPNLNATSATTSFGTTASTMPAALYPSGFALQPIVVRDNGNYGSGMIRINSVGNVFVSIFVTGAAPGAAVMESLTGFTASGTKGFYEMCMFYPKY